MLILVGCKSQDIGMIDGYYTCEEYYGDGFQDYIDYCKYLYKEDADEKFGKSSHYEIVTTENIDEIKKYFANFPYENMDDSSNYDFKMNMISEGDFYYIKSGSSSDNYSVFLYDINSHTLYYIHNNI